ncbi:pseudouridine synthase [Merismopedia glauca]|uniref:Pseudouridine synthase n=1 Tax=Merismopedia glauca CCAP 1448/3 TaxID=1296344 RepID=A0A2T1C8A8_9CYAN|nr:pseudouridine synthase [Merismopedia glauca]PSB04398.1 pseudouridine synthase [Merismopedia glauca CCAP 1448/3]
MHRHILFYKPYGVLSQFTPNQNDSQQETLKNYISIPDVYAVGRLDADSEGLLLLTSDGKLQHRLSDPKFGHWRTYWVQVERIPDEPALEQLRRGVTIQKYRTLPTKVQLLAAETDLPPRTPPIRYRKNVPTSWLEMSLIEGKNRQVRRMTAAVGFPTLRLVRVAIGNLKLESLQPGEWREVSDRELKQLMTQNRRSGTKEVDNDPLAVQVYTSFAPTCELKGTDLTQKY